MLESDFRRRGEIDRGVIDLQARWTGGNLGLRSGRERLAVDQDALNVGYRRDTIDGKPLWIGDSDAGGGDEPDRAVARAGRRGGPAKHRRAVQPVRRIIETITNAVAWIAERVVKFIDSDSRQSGTHTKPEDAGLVGNSEEDPLAGQSV